MAEHVATESNPLMLRAAELNLADTVKLFDGAFGWGLVKKITKDSVVIFRPYGCTEDFSYTGGVICLMGYEEINCDITSSRTFTVVRRKELK